MCNNSFPNLKRLLHEKLHKQQTNGSNTEQNHCNQCIVKELSTFETYAAAKITEKNRHIVLHTKFKHSIKTVYKIFCKHTMDVITWKQTCIVELSSVCKVQCTTAGKIWFTSTSLRGTELQRTSTVRMSIDTCIVTCTLTYQKLQHTANTMQQRKWLIESRLSKCNCNYCK